MAFFRRAEGQSSAESTLGGVVVSGERLEIIR